MDVAGGRCRVRHICGHLHTYLANDEHFVLAVTFAWVRSEVARLEACLVSWSLGGIPVLICAESVVASVATVQWF